MKIIPNKMRKTANAILQDRVIGILKKSNQSIVFLDAIKTPIRELVGKSARDCMMAQIADQLKVDGIISGSYGFMSMACTKPYFYATSFSLTDEFFNEHCKGNRPGVQLQFNF